MKDKQRIGNIIRQKRQLLGMTQQELSDKVGYKARTSINRIENGLVEVPDSKLKKIAEILNCSIGDLLGDTTEKKTCNNSDITQINIDMTYQKALSYNGVSDDDLNEILLQVWYRYSKEYKNIVNDIDDLVLKFYELKNKIKRTNTIYKDILKWFDDINGGIELNNISGDTKNALINDLYEMSRNADKYGTIETLLHALNNRF